MTRRSLPPRADEVEVSVFGPGYGESVLIHAGNGQWIAIDSCIDDENRRSKPLAYLAELGLSPQKVISMIVASHWHDDHVRGIHELLQASTSSYFACSPVLAQREFLALADLYTGDTIRTPRGAEELYRCLTATANRARLMRRQVFRMATADKVLWGSNLAVDAKPVNATLTALSPSDEMCRRGLEFMAQSLAAAKRGIHEGRLIEPMPNDVAVALRLDVENRSILLGSDLQENGDPLVGWSAVLTGAVAPAKKSSLFKVAHHGSKTGHHDAVWSDLLDENPFSLMTPFRWGKHRIPTRTDRMRILALTGRAYISANPDSFHEPRRGNSRKAEVLINRTARNRRCAAGPVGHIRWRAPIFDVADAGRVELFDGAMRLEEVT